METLKKELNEVGDGLEKISVERIVRSVREDRENR